MDIAISQHLSEIRRPALAHSTISSSSTAWISVSCEKISLVMFCARERAFLRTSQTFRSALETFKKRLPGLAKWLMEEISQAHKHNIRFNEASQSCLQFFMAYCTAQYREADPLQVFHDSLRQATPDLDSEKMDTLLCQTLLLERLLSKFFPTAWQMSAIAQQIKLALQAFP